MKHFIKNNNITTHMINDNENIVYNYLSLKYDDIKRMPNGFPDFKVNNEFYIEVKSKVDKLSNSQQRYFRDIKEDIFIYYVDKGVIFKKIKYVPLKKKPSKIKSIHIFIEEDDYNKVVQKKGSMTWTQYLINTAK